MPNGGCKAQTTNTQGTILEWNSKNKASLLKRGGGGGGEWRCLTRAISRQIAAAALRAGDCQTIQINVAILLYCALLTSRQLIEFHTFHPSYIRVAV